MQRLNTMIKDKALRMAIEALEMHVPYYVKDRALYACKEALAVAYQPTSQEQSVMHQAMIRSSKLVHKATPPSREWQSLSDAEIEELYGDCSIEYFRDIEAKLRGKNNA